MSASDSSPDRRIVFNPPTAPAEPLPDDVFPFDHPASDRAHELFLALRITSEEVYRALPIRERYLVDIKSFESQVMNGGMDQFICNSTGDYSLECLEALNAIGATKSHSLLQSACDLFPEGKPASDPEIRRMQYQKITREGKVRLDDLISGDLEFELYDLFLKYWDANEPKKIDP